MSNFNNLLSRSKNLQAANDQLTKRIDLLMSHRVISPRSSSRRQSPRIVARSSTKSSAYSPSSSKDKSEAFHVIPQPVSYSNSHERFMSKIVPPSISMSPKSPAAKMDDRCSADASTASTPTVSSARALTLQSFCPRFVQHRLLTHPDETEPSVFTFDCAILFADASGFTALTEKMAQKKNGAEDLTRAMNSFFGILLKIVDEHGGDVIKFAGDAVSISFYIEDDDDVNNTNEMNRSGMSPAPAHLLQMMQMRGIGGSVIEGARCSEALHNKLYKYRPPNTKDVSLSLHMGLGCGPVCAFLVGGIHGQWDNIVAGEAIDQIAIAEPLAKPGETVCSPQAWEHLRCIASGEEVVCDKPGSKNFVQLLNLNHAMIPYKRRQTQVHPFDISQLHLLKRFVPEYVHRRITAGHVSHLSDMRTATVMFVQVNGANLIESATSSAGPGDAALILRESQLAVFRSGGDINKYLVDDKGCLIIAVFGLPPATHIDDEIRAITSAFALRRRLRKFSLEVSIGITTGRLISGVVGSTIRQEYTIMGDSVNLSARLMQAAAPGEILVDYNTSFHAQDDTDFVDFVTLPPLKVKGKSEPIDVYRPRELLSKEENNNNNNNENNGDQKISENGEGIKSKSIFQKIFTRQTRSSSPTNLTSNVTSFNNSSYDDYDASFIGRTEEQKVLHGMFENTISNHGGVIVIEGKQGIGKSALSRAYFAPTATMFRFHLYYGGPSSDQCLRSVGDVADDCCLSYRTVLLSIFGAILRKNEASTQKGLPSHVLSDQRMRDVCDMVPFSLHKFAPLLNFIVPELQLKETAASLSMKLSKGDRVAKRHEILIELTVGILRVAASASPTMLLLDNAHDMDKASWVVTERLLRTQQLESISPSSSTILHGGNEESSKFYTTQSQDRPPLVVVIIRRPCPVHVEGYKAELYAPIRQRAVETGCCLILGPMNSSDHVHHLRVLLEGRTTQHKRQIRRRGEEIEEIALDQELVSLAFESSEGNALFLTHVVREWYGTGLLQRLDGGHSTSSIDDSITLGMPVSTTMEWKYNITKIKEKQRLPDVVYRCKRCDLDQLKPVESLVLKVASILEPSPDGLAPGFTVANILTGFPYKEKDTEIHDALNVLVMNGFLEKIEVQEEGGSCKYHFCSNLLLTVASDMMLNSHKAESRLEHVFSRMRVGRIVSKFTDNLKKRTKNIHVKDKQNKTEKESERPMPTWLQKQVSTVDQNEKKVEVFQTKKKKKVKSKNVKVDL